MVTAKLVKSFKDIEELAKLLNKYSLDSIEVDGVKLTKTQPIRFEQGEPAIALEDDDLELEINPAVAYSIVEYED
jgi:hypothetical protein